MMRLDSIRLALDCAATKLRMRSCSPTSPDFSGWNWTPKTLPRSTAAANGAPCVAAATQSPVTGAAYEWVK